MYYGIKKSTDLRSPNTEVKKFTSKRAALAWKSIGNGEYTYADPKGGEKLPPHFQRGVRTVWAGG